MKRRPKPAQPPLARAGAVRGPLPVHAEDLSVLLRYRRSRHARGRIRILN